MRALGNDELRGEGYVGQRTQIPVECPHCHWRHFLEAEIDERMLGTPLSKLIRSHLEEWLATRCPDHLGTLLELSKN